MYKQMYMEHACCYQMGQHELAVWCLMRAVGKFSMYHSLEYIIIMSRTVGPASWTSYYNVPGEQQKGLRHFNTEEKKAQVL